MATGVSRFGGSKPKGKEYTNSKYLEHQSPSLPSNNTEEPPGPTSLEFSNEGVDEIIEVK